MSGPGGLPRYRSHKEVGALKIIDVLSLPDGSGTLRFEDPQFSPISVDPGYMTKHQPKVGGYLVVYADGYRSWSPAEAFEDGYTLVS